MKLPNEIRVELTVPLRPGRKSNLTPAALRSLLKLQELKEPLYLQSGTGLRQRGIKYRGEIVRSWQGDDKAGITLQLTRIDAPTYG